jgi:TRAP-type mannitol/chloroaromatic compound transport system permease large subunit
MTGLEWLCIGMLVAFFGLLMLGVPVAITLATAGFVFGALGFGTGLFNLLPARIFGVVANYQWLAIPLFVFMGVMLEKSRLADDLLDVVGHLMGGLRGGMALGIIAVGVLMGATTGIVGATVITLGLLTLPTLLRRGYDPAIACGAICASGTLGQIIPPSLILILLADIMQLSVGTLFAAAVMPGLLLAGLYCVYIVIYGMVRPGSMPPIPREERARVGGRELALRFVQGGGATGRAGAGGAGIDHRRRRGADRGRLDGGAGLDPWSPRWPAACPSACCATPRRPPPRSPR